MPGYDPVFRSQEDRELDRLETDRLLRLLPYYKGFTPCPKCEFGNMTTDLVRAIKFAGRLTQDKPGTIYIASGPRVDVMLRKCPNCGGHVLQKPLDYPGVTL